MLDFLAPRYTDLVEERSDVDLLRAWRAGDAKAGRVLFDRLFPPLRRFFGSKVETGIDDLIQSTLMIAVERSDTLRDDARFKAYVFTVARHELFRSLRASVRAAKVFDGGTTSVADVRTSPSALMQRREDRSVLVTALQRIPIDLQIALELHYWEGMRAREIGEVLDVPTSTITTRLSRARSLLSKQIAKLEEQGDGADAPSAELLAWAEHARELAGGEGETPALRATPDAQSGDRTSKED